MQRLIEEISQLFLSMDSSMDLTSLGTMLAEEEKGGNINENYSFVLDFFDHCLSSSIGSVIDKATDFVTTNTPILLNINTQRTLALIDILFNQNNKVISLITSEEVVSKFLIFKIESNVFDEKEQHPAVKLSKLFGEFHIDGNRRGMIKDLINHSILERKESVAVSIVSRIEDVDIVYFKEESVKRKLFAIRLFSSAFIKDNNEFVEMCTALLIEEERYKTPKFWAGSTFKSNIDFIVYAMGKYYTKRSDLKNWMQVFALAKNNEKYVNLLISHIVKLFKVVDVYKELNDTLAGCDTDSSEMIKNQIENKMFEHIFEQIENQKSIKEIAENHNRIIVETLNKRLETGVVIDPQQINNNFRDNAQLCEACGKHIFMHKELSFTHELDSVNILRCENSPL
eukprot:GAHX01000452.1.p1 GENE.GAHX01000452.1~~GAHX01000452.1.p1  ORF type:complete len:398 (-),score=70.17 GAHX01000452.1:134-1327(-)